MSTTESHTEGVSTDISRRLAPERTSALPAARQFESWVMDEVLPSIRKHGLYIADRVIEEIRTNPKALLAMLQGRDSGNAAVPGTIIGIPCFQGFLCKFNP